MNLVGEKSIVFSPTLAETLGLESTILMSVLVDFARFADFERASGKDWLIIPKERLNSWVSFWTGADTERHLNQLAEQGVIELATDCPDTDNVFKVFFVPSGQSSRSSEPVVVQREFTPSSPKHAVPMHSSWRPSPDAIEVLCRAGIDRSFVTNAVFEFIVYWKDEGSAHKTWNSKFLQHVRYTWSKYQQVENSPDPHIIPTDWRPSQDVLDILSMSRIDLGFALSEVESFILYWRDKAVADVSWNSRFLKRIQFLWAQRHQLVAECRSDQPRSTRDRTLTEDLTDVSWAQL